MTRPLPPPPAPRRRAPSDSAILFFLVIAMSAVILLSNLDILLRHISPPPPPAAPPPFVIWLFSAEADASALPVARFCQTHPGIKVMVRRFDWDFPLLDELPLRAGDEVPSLVQMGSTWMPAAVERGLLQPLSRYVDGSLVQPGLFLPEAWRTCLRDSVPYGIPWYMETRCLFYRTDLLRKPPQRWEELRPTSPGEPLRVRLPYNEWTGLGIFLFQNGADPLDPSSPRFRAALDRFLDFFPPCFPYITAGDTVADDSFDEFAAGTCASFVSGPWMIRLLTERYPQIGDSWAVAPLPSLTGDNVSTLGGANWVIPTRAPQPDLAWEFIQQMTQPGNQVEWQKRTGCFPAVKEAWTIGRFSSDARLAPFLAQIGNARSAPAIPGWARVESVYAGAIRELLGGRITAAEACDTIARALKEEAPGKPE